MRELRHEEWEDLGLAALAVVFAVAATQVRPALALPLFLGGVALAALGLRARGGGGISSTGWPATGMRT